MTFKTQIARYVTPLRVLLTLSLLVFSTTAFDCNLDPEPSPPTFPGGIRVETKEALAGFPSSATRVPFVPNSGIMTAILGPGTGSETGFAGPTNGNGLKDVPLARTNATWTLSVTYTTVIPRCGGRSIPGIFVPSTGIWWVWTCVL